MTAGLKRHHPTRSARDKIARGFVQFLRFFADAFFAKRYGHRAIVLETIAAVPGMMGGCLRHFRSLRRMQPDQGWIQALLDEAENERMHLMTFIEIEKPTWFERWLVIFAQLGFSLMYLLIYLVSESTAHRIVGYLEEEAVFSYTQYLWLITQGEVEDVKAPPVAIKYWNLAPDARLQDVVKAVRADEMRHRDINHLMADKGAKLVLAEKDQRA